MTSAKSVLPQIADAARRLGIESNRVVVAVSGGGDSVALLKAFCELKATLKLDLTVAHLNHGWRGDESAADAEWVRKLAESLNLPIVLESAEVAASEESARRLRYEFLSRTAAEGCCRFVALGHTADDQTETILHHILRGTGLSGLRGIPQKRTLNEHATLVRPLLQIPRRHLETWLQSTGQSWRTDQTNSDSDFTRNRIRIELLPLLRKQFNPQIDRVLTTLAEQAGETSQVIRELASSAFRDALASSSPASIRLRLESLRPLPAPVIRETFVIVWQRQQWPLQGMTFSHWQNLAALARDGGALSLPGHIDARTRGELLVMTKRPAS